MHMRNIRRLGTKKQQQETRNQVVGEFVRLVISIDQPKGLVKGSVTSVGARDFCLL
jgi:hypothetical protein